MQKNDFAKSFVLTSALSIAICLSLLAIAAVVICNIDIPTQYLQPFTTAAMSLGVLLSSYITSAKRSKNGLTLGLSSGLTTFLVVLVGSLLFTEGEITEQVFVKLLAMLSAGGIGGIAGVGRAAKAKPRAIKL